MVAVCLVVASLPWLFGPYQHQAYLLSRALDARGHDVHWLAVSAAMTTPDGVMASSDAVMRHLRATAQPPPPDFDDAHLTYLGSASLRSEALERMMVSVTALNRVAKTHKLDALVTLMDSDVMFRNGDFAVRGLIRAGGALSSRRPALLLVRRNPQPNMDSEVDRAVDVAIPLCCRAWSRPRVTNGSSRPLDCFSPAPSFFNLPHTRLATKVPAVAWLPYHYASVAPHNRYVLRGFAAIASLSPSVNAILARDLAPPPSPPSPEAVAPDATMAGRDDALPIVAHVPHIVEADRFSLSEPARRAARAKHGFGFGDGGVAATTFVVLVQGGNYESYDRKGWDEAIQAFARFRESVGLDQVRKKARRGRIAARTTERSRHNAPPSSRCFGLTRATTRQWTTRTTPPTPTRHGNASAGAARTSGARRTFTSTRSRRRRSRRSVGGRRFRFVCLFVCRGAFFLVRR